ncbi:MAG: glycosyltransferase family 4 protein [Bryobacteraceae bacterium]|nr:glycosyltransferase family 4 protein [Bryobacteraceae bacterium]
MKRDYEEEEALDGLGENIRPLNFLHLTTFYPPYSFGGDAVYLYRLCHALGDAGHRVDVVHCVDSYHLLHPAKPGLQFAQHPNVETHELRSRLKGLSPLLTYHIGRPGLKAKPLRRILNSKQFDVLHFHNISLLGPQTMALEPDDPNHLVKMYTAHEHWLICPTHVLWKLNSRPCDKPECLRCTLASKRPPQLWRYSRLLETASNHVDQFVSPSRFSAGMHMQRGFPRPVGHLPYFIGRRDRDWQDPAPRPHGKPYFLFVGRLETIKGLQTLISIWDRVPDADLLVAGTGTQEVQLRAMASSNPRIKFLGEKNPQDLGALYYYAVACIVPSITFETFGIVCIEAFVRKTPVIVRDLGALPEVVQDSQGGFVYRTDEGLLDAIGRLLAMPRLRDELGQNGYEAFLKYWSTEAHLKIYFRMLRQAAQRKFGFVPWEVKQHLPLPT